MTCTYKAIQPNLELITRPKQLSGSIQLEIVLPGKNRLQVATTASEQAIQSVDGYSKTIHHKHKEQWLPTIDIKRKDRLLKVCYVPATSTTFLAFFLFFLLWPSTVLINQTRQAVCTIKQSILLRCLCFPPI
jgi:hypothetical protein